MAGDMAGAVAAKEEHCIGDVVDVGDPAGRDRSEEHTSELQSL
jgi:hypothetical protein